MSEKLKPQEELGGEREGAYAHFADALDTLEKHTEITRDERTSIERAFSFLELKKQVGAEVIQKAHYALGIRLVDALERIGYFGEQGKPLDYDSRFSFALRNSISNSTLDWGASLTILILTELRTHETDEKKQEKLSEMIHQIQESRGKTSSLRREEFVAMLKSNLRAHALALWLLFREPKEVDSKRFEE